MGLECEADADAPRPTATGTNKAREYDYGKAPVVKVQVPLWDTTTKVLLIVGLLLARYIGFLLMLGSEKARLRINAGVAARQAQFQSMFGSGAQTGEPLEGNSDSFWSCAEIMLGWAWLLVAQHYAAKSHNFNGQLISVRGNNRSLWWLAAFALLPLYGLGWIQFAVLMAVLFKFAGVVPPECDARIPGTTFYAVRTTIGVADSRDSKYIVRVGRVKQLAEASTELSDTAIMAVLTNKLEEEASERLPFLTGEFVRPIERNVRAKPDARPGWLWVKATMVDGGYVRKSRYLVVEQWYTAVLLKFRQMAEGQTARLAYAVIEQIGSVRVPGSWHLALADATVAAAMDAHLRWASCRSPL
jgi:hypothetical protein